MDQGRRSRCSGRTGAGLPSMIVINSIIGPKKTAAYVGLVVVLSALVGWGYGALA